MSNPYITGLPWAGGNYPTGSNPWNGQPQGVIPLVTYFTPNQPVPAEDLNYILNQRDNALLWQAARTPLYYTIEEYTAGGGAAFGGGTNTTSFTARSLSTTFSAGNAFDLSTLSVATLAGDVIEGTFTGLLGFEKDATSTTNWWLGAQLGYNENGGGYNAIGPVMSFGSSINTISAVQVQSFTVSSTVAHTIATPGTFKFGMCVLAFAAAGGYQFAGEGNWACKIRHLRPC